MSVSPGDLHRADEGAAVVRGTKEDDTATHLQVFDLVRALLVRLVGDVHAPGERPRRVVGDQHLVVVTLAEKDRLPPCLAAVLGAVEVHPVRQPHEVRRSRRTEPDLRVRSPVRELLREGDVGPRRAAVERDVRLVCRAPVRP